jgi:hypothetical protein
MIFLKRRGGRFDRYEEPLEDPIAGVANLFDVSVVFIVSMMIALFSAYHMMDMMNPKSDMTMVARRDDGTMEIIRKKGHEIKVQKVTGKHLSGEGKRLGTAYRLRDGKVVYVPE